MFRSLWPRGLQHTRLPCPSLLHGVCSNSSPLSRWCHPTISSSVIPFSCPQSSPASECFPKSWFFTSGGQSIGACFSISPSNECSGLISFRSDWFDLLAVPRDSQDSSPAPQFKGIHSSAFSLLNCPTLTSIHDYWKNHSLDYTDLCQQNDVWFLICYLGLS